MSGGTSPQAIAIFIAVVLFTLLITWRAARRTRTKDDFYAASGGVKAWQNGFAISGDFLSAASFLGITGLIYESGLDGMLYVIGVMAAWPLMLFLIAERFRNLGKYTLVDAVTERLGVRPLSMLAGLSSLGVVIFYLVGQVVGAGKLIELLFGIRYTYAVGLVSVLMIFYVAFGGMLATTWIQLIKACLLLVGATYLGVSALAAFGFNLNTLYASAAQAHPAGRAILGSGVQLKSPGAVLTVMLTLMLGPMGLPHILMRFFTVKDAADARKSAFYATTVMAYFYTLMLIFGYAAIVFLERNPIYHDARGALIGGSNMVALHLTRFFGGDLAFGFMSAVAFATILAVMAGVGLAGAGALVHDIYSRGIRREPLSAEAELKTSRYAVLAFGVLAFGLGVLFQNENIAVITSMAMAIAASVNFPIILLSLYWRGLTTRGAMVGGSISLLLTVALTLVGPSVMVDVLGYSHALFPYPYPTIITVPLAFVLMYLASITDKSAAAAKERAKFQEIMVRSELGVSSQAG
ncbi:MAG: sodium:solute symporter family transporter [Bryobacteraceae bacterium]